MFVTFWVPTSDAFQLGQSVGEAIGYQKGYRDGIKQGAQPAKK